MAPNSNKDIFSIKREAATILSEIASASFSLEKIEESADRLGAFGERALPFVARHLEKEKSHEALKKLLHLIELLNDASYASILREALSNGSFRNSPLKTRVEIMATLKSYEITPFQSSPGFLNEGGEDAFIIWAERVLEDFHSREYRAISLLEEILLGDREKHGLIEKVADASGEAAIPLLSILAGSDKRDASSAAIKCLGRIKADGAVLALKELRAASWDKEITDEADRAIRRLAFSGYNTGQITFASKERLPEGSRLYASPIDGLGNINLCIAIKKESNRFETTFLLLNDETGIIDTFGSSNMKENELYDMLAETGRETAIKEVPRDYLFKLLNNALHLNERCGIPLSPEFHYRKRAFNDFLKPEAFSPAFDALPAQKLKRDKNIIYKGNKLFDKMEFDGWTISTPQTFDFAEKLSFLEAGEKRFLSVKKNKLISDFCLEVIAPIKRQLSSRLFMMADFLTLGEGDEEAVNTIISTALNLAECDSRSMVELPFLRVMAEKSIIHCIEALDEGFDLREFDIGFDELE